MKKIVLIITVFSLTLMGCSEYQKLLKSNDYNLKYEHAIKYYNAEEYVRAATLFEELFPIFKGTSKAETIGYYIAFCSYGLRDYIQAGYYFRNFYKDYSGSSYTEETLYMSAYCYYMQSPNPRLDQTSTKDAIDEFQLYINRYPNSSRVEKCNLYIDEMRDKLVYKSYLSAKNYFDREHYKAAIIALQNSIKEYPGSKYRENLMFMLLESRFQLAVNSVPEKQRERYNLVKEEYYSFIDEYPQSENKKDADRMNENTDKYLNKYKK